MTLTGSRFVPGMMMSGLVEQTAESATCGTYLLFVSTTTKPGLHVFVRLIETDLDPRIRSTYVRFWP